jgi:hypothetical protein
MRKPHFSFLSAAFTTALQEKFLADTAPKGVFADRSADFVRQVRREAYTLNRGVCQDQDQVLASGGIRDDP